MRRGDIVTVAGGVYASKTSAALIVQDDRFEATNLVAVYPFTALGLRWQLVLIESVAHSLKILPDLRIVHSDLKPSNIKRTELGLHDHLRPPPQPSLLNRRPHAAKTIRCKRLWRSKSIRNANISESVPRDAPLVSVSDLRAP